jgi:hypothetical protein
MSFDLGLVTRRALVTGLLPSMIAQHSAGCATR